MNKFYITTAIPYVNAKPHVGHALEFVQSDVIKRFHTVLGKKAILLSGSDENALKNVQAAEKEKINTKDFVDKNSKLFEELARNLNIEFDFFQKGSNQDHYLSSQDLWEKCYANGDIYKKEYEGFYCVGCELFYEPEELNENGECYEHPGKPLDKIEEANYFFRLSNYTEKVSQLLESGDLEIIPSKRKNEMISFLKNGLSDISISRSNERAKNWGVPVPNDPTQVMYVWFDALNIYRSGLKENYEEYWPADIHVIGKGITRFHAIYWPAFLLSANIPLPKSIFVHGYFTVDGQKMSKTLGNVIDPNYLIGKYGTDSLRYYLLSQISPTEDGDFSENNLINIYNSDLANGLGNLIARVAKLCEKVEFEHRSKVEMKLSEEVTANLNKFRFNDALSTIWSQIRITDGIISSEEPWKFDEKEKLKEKLQVYVANIVKVAVDLQPFLPETSRKILDQFEGQIKFEKPLFPRLS